jgi:hypothetical protein
MEWGDGREPAEEEYEFYGGLAAMYQHPDGALEVRTGWGIVEAFGEGEQTKGKVELVRGGGSRLWE